jgi:hypothetical protein
MHSVIISGTGLFTPAQSISNAELVEAFNAYATGWNADNAEAIAAGTLQAMQTSSEGFIEKASGIGARFVIDKNGILDPTRMCPSIPERPDDAPSASLSRCLARAHSVSFCRAVNRSSFGRAIVPHKSTVMSLILIFLFLLLQPALTQKRVLVNPPVAAT